MRDLNYQLKQLCIRNRDGSFSTQKQREQQLNLIANQLHELGFRKLKHTNISTKHVNHLVNHWVTTNLSAGTIKNRLSAVRWWAEKTNRQSILPKDNAKLGVPNRVFVTNLDRSARLTSQALEMVRDSHVKMSLQLQEAFGLRREEAIKFNASYADRGHNLQLKGSWTKGGKPREIPIRTAEQRDLINRVKSLTGNGSLIPSNRNYIQQLRIYERHTSTAGLSKMHGLRHAYAQQRYEELTGWKSPASGGPSNRLLNDSDKKLDFEARITISGELGHEREQITSVYLGR